jgi:hypothetical protein
MSHWRITHRDIQHRALGESAFEGEITKTLNDIHTVAYSLQFTDPLCKKDKTRPYVTDFELRRHDFTVLAGEHTAVEGSNDSGVLRVAGKSWEHYLERQFWPFNPQDVLQYKYVKTNTDTATIITDLLNMVLSFPNTLDLDYDLEPTGTPVNFKIETADTENIFQKIKTLGEQEPGGFDFQITPQRNFLLYAPEKDRHPDFRAVEGDNLLSLTYTNNGLDGNWVLGLGAGSNQRRGVIQEDVDSQVLRRRHMSTRDFGNVIDIEVLGRLTQGELTRAAKDVLVLRAVIQVSDEENVWDRVEPGDSIFVQGTVAETYDFVSKQMRVTSMTGRINALGDEQVEFGFDDEETQ